MFFSSLPFLSFFVFTLSPLKSRGMTLTSESLKTLKVAELREELDRRGLDSTGLKAALLARLEEALLAAGGGDASTAAPVAEAAAAPAPAAAAPGAEAVPAAAQAPPTSAPAATEKVRSMDVPVREETPA